MALRSLAAESERVVEQALTQAVVERSMNIIDRQNLRALDAVQLASALVVQQALKSSDSLVFIASDKKLLDAAMAEHLHIWDPASDAPLPIHPS